MRSSMLWLAALLAAALAMLPLAARADAPSTPPSVAAADVPPWQGVDKGIASIPGAERGIVLQARGKAWRELRPPVVAAGGSILAASLFHMYLGTIGVKGALHAMLAGTVDEQWAREHHEIWYQDVKAGRSRQHFVERVPADATLAPTGDD